MNHKIDLSRLNLFSSVILLYGMTLFIVWAQIDPLISRQFSPAPQSYALAAPRKIPESKRIQIRSGVPSKIEIPKLSLTKAVLPGIYDEKNDTWNVSDSDVHFAELSSNANDFSGATLIYGHNNRFTLGRLSELAVGDQVNLTTQNNYRMTYSLVSVSDNEPNNTSIFDYSGPPILVLQTCSGAFNESRRFYTFELSGVVRNV